MGRLERGEGLGPISSEEYFAENPINNSEIWWEIIRILPSGKINGENIPRNVPIDVVMAIREQILRLGLVSSQTSVLDVVRQAGIEIMGHSMLEKLALNYMGCFVNDPPQTIDRLVLNRSISRDLVGASVGPHSPSEGGSLEPVYFPRNGLNERRKLSAEMIGELHLKTGQLVRAARVVPLRDGELPEPYDMQEIVESLKGAR